MVARRGRQLVFCEVKAKLGERYGDPAEMVGDEKQRRLEVRFDVVAVTPRGIERVVDAF